VGASNRYGEKTGGPDEKQSPRASFKSLEVYSKTERLKIVNDFDFSVELTTSFLLFLLSGSVGPKLLEKTKKKGTGTRTGTWAGFCIVELLQKHVLNVVSTLAVESKNFHVTHSRPYVMEMVYVRTYVVWSKKSWSMLNR